ncbi:DUF1800 domain-containing protein [Consotaella aegiceratis]|uniref:DUF1800 domain-containing protein n=1 Tax=Consotaella aegiceratis TaxID=3097961 RepID=UPI002F42B71E
MSTISASQAMARFGLGFRVDGDRAARQDARGALLAALDHPKDALLRDDDLPDSREAFALTQAAQQARRKGMDAPDGPTPQNPAALYRSEAAARLKRMSQTQTGVLERLVAFWTNHFCVQAGASQAVRAMAGAFEREAIRPHVLGKFEDMLVAVTRHPAMLLYLNNAGSVGPDSVVGQRRGRGLNENHARELMELHTLGVSGGYDQADVVALAQTLTGWSFGRNADRVESYGQFQFNKGAHEPGEHTIMGVSYTQKGESQGMAVLTDLARSPATAHHLATKLARHFVADEPPSSLVETLASSYLASDGDLKALSKTLLTAEEAWTAPPTKIRSPQEFVWAVVRAVEPNVEAPFVLRAFEAAGQPLWNPPSPAGFNDGTSVWLAPSGLTTRLEIAERLASRSRKDDPRQVAEAVLGDALSPATRQAIERAESSTQGLALLLMSPEFQRR